MDMVKLIALTTFAAGMAAASDFSIEIGSPSAAINPNLQTVSKVKNAVFSLRVKDCANPQLSGASLSESQMKQSMQSLVFTPGSTVGAFAVSRNTQAYGKWIAVITAECGGNKIGVFVPVNAEGVYDRAAAKFVPHAPTPAEMEEQLRAMQARTK